MRRSLLAVTVLTLACGGSDNPADTSRHPAEASRQAASAPVASGPGASGAGADTIARLPHVAALERAPVNMSDPATAPDDWLLAMLDVETTGLVPGHHEMIDLGMVVTDAEGNVIDSLFLRVQPEHPERASQGAIAVNAFDAERWQELGALSGREAVDSLRSFHLRVANGRSVIIVAFNSQFDAAFLDHLFRSADASWRELYHYFVLDIPSMAWALGFRELSGGALARRLGIPDEPRVAEEHTGITGAMLNARIYQALRARGMEPVPPESTLNAPS